ncbi:hypothetical protein GCM10027282_01980 [Frigoribacterium salinisoli]
MNFAEQPATLEVAADEVLFTSDASVTAGSSLTLPAHSVAVVR